MTDTYLNTGALLMIESYFHQDIPVSKIYRQMSRKRGRQAIMQQRFSERATAYWTATNSMRRTKKLQIKTCKMNGFI